jgi:putative glutathione S-transferase
MLVDGKWQDVWYDTKRHSGAFVRQESPFRDRVTADGSSGFPAAAGRYHLYVSLACPWAHRRSSFDG